MSKLVPDYDHAALRLKAMQARNVGKLIQAARAQKRVLKDDGIPEPAWLALVASIDALKPILAQLKKEMVTIVKGSILHEWTKETHGIGPGLFYALGQMPPLVEFATVSKVWKYCGLHVTDDGRAPRRKRGEGAGFSPELRSAVLFRVGDPIVKVGGPYRAVYDQRRAHCQLTHPDWTDGHRHADAMRVMVKAVLRDAWRVAHGQRPRASATVLTTPERTLPESEGQSSSGAHVPNAAGSGDPGEAAAPGRHRNDARIQSARGGGQMSHDTLSHGAAAQGPDLTDAHDKHAPGGGPCDSDARNQLATSRGSTINQSAPTRTSLTPGGAR